MGKITFGITTYLNNKKREAYFYECLDSIYNQTNPNWEILINDNVSPININLSKYNNDKRIKLFKQKENLGMFNGWNFLINKCNTKWFVTMCDDDIINENYVENILNITKNNNDIEAIFYDAVIVKENLEPMHRLQGEINSGFYKGGKDTLNYFLGLKKTPLFLITVKNTEKLKNIGGYKDFGHSSDIYILYMTLYNFNIFYDKGVDYLYLRMHDTNHSKNIKKISKEEKILYPALIKDFGAYLNKENLKKLTKIKKSQKINYIKSNIIDFGIKVTKKIGFYDFASKFWRKHILKIKTFE